MKEEEKKQKVALVTGASRGIGQAIAELLAARGVYVIGTATTEKGAETISNYLSDKGRGMVLDVTDLDSIKTFCDKRGSIDILVNNAGITCDGFSIRMTPDNWDSVITTNLTSVFHLSKAVIPAMIKKRFGRIITIGSVVGTTGNAGQSSYAAAKAGVIGFSKSLAREVASRGITVNVVAPGFIDTDMTKALTEEQRDGILSKIPLNRLGEVKDIANVVAFLASDEASYVTGETIHVNGGMYMS